MDALPLVCNKRELAEKLSLSVPTIDALLSRHGDEFPVRQRGSNGIPWEFDLPDVIAFLRHKDEDETRAIAERRQAFEQFRLPLDDLASPEAEGLSPQQRNALSLARMREHELALAVGQVVRASEVEDSYRTLFRTLGRAFDTLPGQLARKFGLPDAVARAVREWLDEQRRQIVRTATDDLLTGTHG